LQAAGAFAIWRGRRLDTDVVFDERHRKLDVI
jgi:hypothetical protein